jgi:hypothetical protein
MTIDACNARSLAVKTVMVLIKKKRYVVSTSAKLLCALCIRAIEVSLLAAVGMAVLVQSLYYSSGKEIQLDFPLSRATLCSHPQML